MDFPALDDNFQRADGTLSGSAQKVAGSGFEWATTGAHLTEIESGYLTMVDVKSISAITSVGTTATVTCTGHALVNDGGVSANRSTVLISGASPSAYNGVYDVSYVDANTYTYTFAGTGGVAATGTMTQTSTGNGGGGYSNINVKRTPRRMSADFSFVNADVGSSDALNGAALVLIASRNSNFSLSHMIHFKITRQGWSFQIRRNGEGTPWDFLSQGSWATPLAMNTVYTYTLDIDGDTITSYCPDGSTKVVTDSDIPNVIGPYLTYQTAYGTDNNDPRIRCSRAYASPAIRGRV